nr:putative ankyrin repeat protein RF_1087 [Cherax quadricarinatus]
MSKIKACSAVTVWQPYLLTLLRCTCPAGGTALVLAVKAGHKATVNLLLQRGADAQILDDNGESVAQHASRGGHTAILEQLWKHNSLLTSLNSTAPTPCCTWLLNTAISIQ